MLDIKKKRTDGIPLHCDECGKTETAEAIEKKHFSCVAADNNRFLCITCKNRLYKAASKAKKVARDVGFGT
jgi:predicted nucleic-acid-binding Zn-ribbon protein